MPLFLPNNDGKILLHCCCAPCSCSIIDVLLENHIAPTLFFYNPNIHPKAEYEKRKHELIRYAEKREVLFVDAEYKPDLWFHAVKGLEKEPEKGKRCSVCFEMRLRKAAEYASMHGFKVISTTLGISRWKHFDQVVRAGILAVAPFQEVSYFDYNFRKGIPASLAKKISQEENFYRQSYCGCLFSQRN